MELASIQQEHQDQDLSPSQISSKTYTRDLIQDEEAFESLLARLDDAPGFAYDTETNGTFDRFKVGAVGISIAVGEGDPYACYIPFNHFEGKQLSIDYVLGNLQPYFESDQWWKICHNAKFDEMVMARHGINVKGFGHCTYVMAWLLSEDSTSKSLKSLVPKYFGVSMETYEDVINAAPKKKGVPRDYNFARVALDSAAAYAADDAYWAYRLFEVCRKKLVEEKLWDAYVHVDGPFVRILRNIEAKGVYIDMELVEHADKRLPELYEEVEASIYEAAGEVFNIGSGKQLGPILFEKLGIGKNVPKTKSGQYSTDKNTLKLYAKKHPIVADVLRRKKIQKTHSTFVEGTKTFVSEDGRIHPSFNGCGTVTGRLSCTSPNLQQIEGDEVEEITVRNFFIPAPGNSFVVADYGQVELRVMAHFSRDEKMIQSFLSGRDFHEETARGMYNLADDEDVLPRQRFYAKSINFGIGYGRGPMSVAEQMDVSFGEAKEVIRKWHENFPAIQAYKKHVWKEARKSGYIRTITGRKRRVPDIVADQPGIRAAAERQAFSSKIQGSAADIIKMAMIALQPKLDDYGAYMILQIHDELVIESPTDQAPAVLETVRTTMETPLNGKNPLRLPLVVDPKIVERWGDAK